MQLEFKRLKHTLIVDITGDMDMLHANTFKTRLDDCIERDHIRRLILNLEGVTFLDSSGLGVVIGRYKTMAARQGEMYIVGASPAVKKVLIFSGVNKIIPLYRSEHEIADI
jgi:stage II sporulation protein AA (anti-sigma F factor antagonist)